ncbi:ATP-dependent nuclease [Vagococcus salmoninarum]|uniref:ATP-dependent nuclease n=1 Tax=Vagococcus salmoninarum TaxID=2739 RepID=UPI0018814243|nr:AAA family ATPase [Vagococcus salmoninarum]MBE9390247.1 AAA family ATPase [Vagococcus salmoninarum]
MKISRVEIINYRNLKEVDVKLKNIVALIGENNSGKSNFLKAITLPLLANDIGFTGKNLSWSDINVDARNEYYKFILENKSSLIKDDLSEEIKEKLLEKIPEVKVKLELKPEEREMYFVKKLESEIVGEKIKYEIEYIYSIKDLDSFIDYIQVVINEFENDGKILEEKDLDSIKMNLLPTNFYEYKIIVPNKNEKVSFDKLKLFRYSAITAERDSFANNENKIGADSLIKLLDSKLEIDQKVKIENEYNSFFEVVKSMTQMEKIFNWQEDSDIENAKDFFEKINILPNMPSMKSVLSSVKLGYDDQYLTSQGLGYRNLILLLVMINSLTEKDENIAYSMLTVEEPEAHLCINNQKIMISFIKSKLRDNKQSQLFYSTHSTEFINKLNIDEFLVVSNGRVVSLAEGITEPSKQYLSRNPNTDIFNFLFSKKCILVEGLTEELLIKGFIDSQSKMSDIEVISFHKGYIDIMDIWLKVNKDTNNRLGIIRDSDFQDKAKIKHHEYENKGNIFVGTTISYSLEHEIVNKEANFSFLNEYFKEKKFIQEDFNTTEDMIGMWIKDKGGIMYQLSKDLSVGNLNEFEMPDHIVSVISRIQNIEPITEESDIDGN